MELPPDNGKQGGCNSTPNQSTRQKNGNNVPDALSVAGGLILLVIGTGFHSAGGFFHIIGFMFDFLVVCCGLTVITHHVEKFKNFGKCYWLFVFVAFVLFGSLSIYVSKKDHPKSKPYPRFTFALRDPKHTKKWLWLTNDFLKYNDFGKLSINKAFLLMPMWDNESNVTLELLAKNDSVLAEYPEFGISIEENAPCVPETGWVNADSLNVYLVSNLKGGFKTNLEQMFICSLPAVLAGDGKKLPLLNLNHPPIEQAISFMALAKGKDTPVQAVSFALFFAPATNFLDGQPFVELPPFSNGMQTISIPPSPVK